MKRKTFTIIAALLAIAQGAFAQTTVNDEDALNNAIAATDGETASIRLGADITLSAYLKIGESEEQTVVIDLNGHKLRRNLGAVDANGHVIEVFEKGELTVKDMKTGGEITGGRANNGGGICNYGTLHLEGGAITGCYADVSGGGVRNNGTMTMSDGTILGCWGRDCGGIYNAEGASLTITGGAVSGNTSNAGGGGVVNYGTAKVSNCTITGNHAATRGGGIWNGGELTVEASTIDGNRADVEGGGIYFKAGGNYTSFIGFIQYLNNVVIRNNTSPDGGGAYVQGSGYGSDTPACVYMGGCTITGNSSTEHGGGGITNHGTVIVEGATITGNSCHTYGGGIWNGGTLTMQGAVKINGNENPVGRSNLYLTEGKVVNFTDALSDDAVIGVSMEENGVFTNEYGKHHTNVNHFFLDVDGYDLAVNTDGEAYQYLSKRKYIECSWDEKNKRVVRTVKEIPAGQAVDNLCTSKYANGGDLWGDTYWFVADGSASISGQLTCQGKDVHLILCDGASVKLGGITIGGETKLHIYCQSYGSKMGKLVSEGNAEYQEGIGNSKNKYANSIFIHGGDIYAKGGDRAVGIGMIYMIYIYGGKVKAYGGKYAAGIGGDWGDNGGTITICGGKVEAHGGEYAAGIGGGRVGYGGTITISDGQVEAHGGKYAAGIGSGARLETDLAINGGTITINGGRVEARGGETGAGIGGGLNANGGTITISGGEVYAYGGNDASGIGSGEEENLFIDINGGTITISGGYVYAKGDDVAAGIGAGEDADMGIITITGGIVEAHGGSSNESWVNAINTDDDNDGVNSITLGDNMMVSSERDFTYPERYDAVKGRKDVVIKPCTHSDGGYTISDGLQHKLTSCKYCLMGGTSEAHAFDGGSKCVCGLLGLKDDADNTPVLVKWNNTTQTVALLGSTFSQVSRWSTLCLPFDLAPENMPSGAGKRLKTLEKATFDTRTGTLTLHFADANNIVAGKPCLVKWKNAGVAVSNPLFTNVTLKSLAPQDESPSDIVKFRGTYAPVTLKAGDPALYLDSEGRLRLPGYDTTVGAFHSWFQTNTSSLGDVNSDDMITVVDVTMLVDHILGRESAGFVVGNSDVNGDEMVSVADVTELVDIILHGGYNVKNVVVVGAGDLTLSTTSLRIAAGATGTVEVTSGSGSYEVKSSDSGVATASIDGITITVTAISEGEATITVTDTESYRTTKIAVSVSMLPSYLTCPDDHHPHLIDLGLPSGTMWACCNVGADKPEAYGGYYAWGETVVKDYYDWNTYIHCEGSYDTCHDLGGDIAGTQYDVAHVKWGGNWVMPSLDQIKELLDNCNYEWIFVGDVKGQKFTSKTNGGGSIFLPAAGYRLHDVLLIAGGDGLYWSSTQGPSYSYYAYGLYFNSGDADWYDDFNRYCGRTVRPVSK